MLGDVPRAPEFGTVPQADQSQAGLASIAGLDERARALVEIAVGGTAEDYTAQSDAPWLILISPDEPWQYGEATFDGDGIIDGYDTAVASSFFVPINLPWKIRSPGEGNAVSLLAATTDTRIFILEVD